MNNDQLRTINIALGSSLDLAKKGLSTEEQRNIRLGVVSVLVGRKVKSTKDLTSNEYRQLRDTAYPNWLRGNWNIAPQFQENVRKVAMTQYGVKYE